METYTLEGINVEQKTSKEGKPYVTAGILINGKWHNSFLKKAEEEAVRLWQKGDTVTLELYKEDYNGKTYDKFKVPDRMDELEARIVKLERSAMFNSGAVSVPTSDSGIKIDTTPAPIMTTPPSDDFVSEEKEILPF